MKIQTLALSALSASSVANAFVPQLLSKRLAFAIPMASEDVEYATRPLGTNIKTLPSTLALELVRNL
jgi:hypothetical protein